MKTISKPWGAVVEIKKPHYVTNRVHVGLKKLSVLPGQCLSLQSHEWRNELWYIVQGLATVQIVNHKFDTEAGEMVYIKAGKNHRLINRGENVLIVIEVSFGSRISEEDIKRHDDMYGRVLLDIK